jgi:hypothetical protein
MLHRQSDGFWQSYDTAGNRLTQVGGISKIGFGTLDESLFQLMQSAQDSEKGFDLFMKIRHGLHYFDKCVFHRYWFFVTFGENWKSSDEK